MLSYKASSLIRISLIILLPGKLKIKLLELFESLGIIYTFAALKYLLI